jgi:hypothetical protein
MIFFIYIFNRDANNFQNIKNRLDKNLVMLLINPNPFSKCKTRNPSNQITTVLSRFLV